MQPFVPVLVDRQHILLEQFRGQQPAMQVVGKIRPLDGCFEQNVDVPVLVVEHRIKTGFRGILIILQGIDRPFDACLFMKKLLDIDPRYIKRRKTEIAVFLHKMVI